MGPGRDPNLRSKHTHKGEKNYFHSIVSIIYVKHQVLNFCLFACVCAKLVQSCRALCDPKDGLKSPALAGEFYTTSAT